MDKEDENNQKRLRDMENGFSSFGFYVGFLLILILVVGIYVAYTGLIKRETTKPSLGKRLGQTTGNVADTKKSVQSSYTLTVYVDESQNLVIIKNPTISE